MASLCEQIRTERAAGRVTCETYHGDGVLPRALRLKGLGFRDIPPKLWVTVNRTDALQILAACLHRDLAHDAEIMPAERASYLAQQFLSMFPPAVELRTNGNPYRLALSVGHQDLGWEPITGSPLDTGIVVERDGLLGILWVEDDD